MIQKNVSPYSISEVNKMVHNELDMPFYCKNTFNDYKVINKNKLRCNTLFPCISSV